MLTGPATAPSSTGGESGAITIGPHTTALNNCTPLCGEPRASCIHRIRRNEICPPLTRKAWLIVTSFLATSLGRATQRVRQRSQFSEEVVLTLLERDDKRRDLAISQQHIQIIVCPASATFPYNTSTDQRAHAQPRGTHAPALGRRGAAPSASEAAWGAGLRAEGTHVLANLPDLHPQPNPRRAGQFDRF